MGSLSDGKQTPASMPKARESAAKHVLSICWEPSSTFIWSELSCLHMSTNAIPLMAFWLGHLSTRLKACAPSRVYACDINLHFAEPILPAAWSTCQSVNQSAQARIPARIGFDSAEIHAHPASLSNMAAANICCCCLSRCLCDVQRLV